MTRKPLCKVYAASCAEDGGITEYLMYSDGKLEEKSNQPLDRPMYFIKKEDIFHVILRSPDGFNGISAYISYSDKDKKPSAPIGTEGVVACHLCENGGSIYAVNYVSGSICKLGGKTVAHKKADNMLPGRQDAPHAHCVIPSPCGKYLLCTDLGLDRIFVYDTDLNSVSSCALPKGSGIRHICFDKTGKYLYGACELDGSAAVLEWKDGVLTHIANFSSHTRTEKNLAAAIRASSDGRYLYISQRGDDCVTVFECTDGGRSLNWMGNFDCGGNAPRDMILTPNEDYIICANEKSGSLTVLSLKNGSEISLASKTPLKNALCVIAENI